MFGFSSFFQQTVASNLGLPPAKYLQLVNGKLEYVTYGQGKPVLIIHGGVGGFDQSLVLFRNLIPSGYQLICPSRPGYLGTELSVGKSIDEQVELMNQLIELLNLTEVTIVAVSAGGLIAYPFAIKYPHKIKALITISAISSRYLLPKQISRWAQSFFMSDAGLWLTKESFAIFPEMTIKKFLDSGCAIKAERMDDLVKNMMQSPREMALMNEIMSLMIDYHAREAGTTNDISNGENLVKFDLSKINCPSLIVHGTHDNEVRFYNGVYAYEEISAKNKERIWIDYGTHFSFFFPSQNDKAQDKFMAFLDKYS